MYMCISLRCVQNVTNNILDLIITIDPAQLNIIHMYIIYFIHIYEICKKCVF